MKHSHGVFDVQIRFRIFAEEWFGLAGRTDKLRNNLCQEQKSRGSKCLSSNCWSWTLYGRKKWKQCQPFFGFGQSSGAMWKSRWPSWAPVPNKPTVSVDVKQHSANWTSVLGADIEHATGPFSDPSLLASRRGMKTVASDVENRKLSLPCRRHRLRALQKGNDTLRSPFYVSLTHR